MKTQPKSVVPMTERLKKLLKPSLFDDGKPIFTERLEPPKEKVYALTKEQIQAIRARRGSVIELDPGMGGIAPDKLQESIDRGIKLTSLDYMLTKDCNLSCLWCFAGCKPGMTEHLPFETLEKVTEEAIQLGTSLFVLTGGEPLVYKDPKLSKQTERGDHFFRVVKMINDTAGRYKTEVKILTFDDVALINSHIAEQFAKYKVGLCTKGDTLESELQDYKVNCVGAFKRMQEGYKNLIRAGYGHEPGAPDQKNGLRLVVNSVLDQTTFDGMVDLHFWVRERGFNHSIVPIHYCGAAENEKQELGIHSHHVAMLYQLLAAIDEKYFGINWEPWSAFSEDKTCNRNKSGLHIRSNGDVTACSESPGKDVTDDYTFGNVNNSSFSLRTLVESKRLAEYRNEFAAGHGIYICAPELCDLNANDLCRGGCAVRSAYSKVDKETGFIVPNPDRRNYSRGREDVLCPAWTLLAMKQKKLGPGLLEAIHERLVTSSTRITASDFPFRPFKG